VDEALAEDAQRLQSVEELDFIVTNEINSGEKITKKGKENIDCNADLTRDYFTEEVKSRGQSASRSIKVGVSSPKKKDSKEVSTDCVSWETKKGDGEKKKIKIIGEVKVMSQIDTK